MRLYFLTEVSRVFSTDLFLKSSILSYRKTRQSHPEKLLQEVDIDLISELNEGNKEEELGKILRLLRHYRETGLQNIKFTISFFDKQLLKEEGVLPDHKKRHLRKKLPPSSDFCGGGGSCRND